jgi:uncharacterized membrane protein YphA (DoxX/SURF4 family)
MGAISKITDLRGFADKLVVDSGLSESWSLAVAAFLPWLELTCGVCLLLHRATREAAMIATILIIVFIFYTVDHWGQADCGCLIFPAVGFNDWRGWPLLRDALLFLCGLRVLRG